MLADDERTDARADSMIIGGLGAVLWRARLVPDDIARRIGVVAGVGGVVAGFEPSPGGPDLVGHDGEAAVEVIVHGVHVYETHDPALDPRLFPQLTQGRILYLLARLRKANGQAPHSLVGILVPLDQQDLPALVDGDNTIGVIATPALAAQDVADAMVGAGISSILNFAPTVIAVPDGVDPFVLLLSRAGKRRLAMLTLAAGSALLGHWLDLYVMIVPGVLPGRPVPGLLEVGLALGVGTACVWTLRFPGLSTTGSR